MTTKEKVRSLADALTQLRPDEMRPEVRGLLSNYQMLAGVAGFAGIKLPANPIEMIVPLDDGASTELALDSVISLLIELRGDDLPPFDPNRYGEGTIDRLIGSLRHGSN